MTTAHKTHAATGEMPVSPASPMTPPASGVKIRMYRQGLGDCFLLAFPTEAGKPFYLLIDCGVIVGQVPGRPSIAQVAQHIKESTGGHLDVLVATHQHWDHLSGFVDAQEVFDTINIDELWLAWTEDPADPLAQTLNAKNSKAALALTSSVNHLAALAPALAPNDGEFSTALHDVLGFLGADRTSRTTQAALDYLGTKANPVYRRPSDPSFPLPGVPDARVYILGPPHAEEKIKSYNDKTSDPQTYRASALALATQTEFLAAAFDPSDRDENPIPKAPFDARHAIPEHAPRYQELKSTYFTPHNAWREISVDWLRGASSLALNLDNATNNTSLALAIELEPKGKVLLFPADAQVGNWLSWHDQTWTDADGRAVTAEDLLSRTVFYKVGHHCSHNATLRQRGLELMTSDELVAFAPLDVETAKKKNWPMPWPKLRTGLLAATKGRIVQVDDKLPPQQRDCPAGCSADVWTEFQKKVTADPEIYYYFEITIT